MVPAIAVAHSAIMDTTDMAHSAITDTAVTTDTMATNTATVNSATITVSDRGDTTVLDLTSACASDPGQWTVAGVARQMDLANVAQWRKEIADVEVKMDLADMAMRMDLPDVDLSDISTAEDLGSDLVALDVEGWEEGRKKDAAAGKMIIGRTKALKPLLLKG